MMSDQWSSFQKDFLAMEAWRRHINEEPQKVEEFLGFGKKTRPSDCPPCPPCPGEEAPLPEEEYPAGDFTSLFTTLDEINQQLPQGLDKNALYKELEQLFKDQNFVVQESTLVKEAEEEVHGGALILGRNPQFDLSRYPTLSGLVQAAGQNAKFAKALKTAFVRAGFKNVNIGTSAAAAPPAPEATPTPGPAPVVDPEPTPVPEPFGAEYDNFDSEDHPWLMHNIISKDDGTVLVKDQWVTNEPIETLKQYGDLGIADNTSPEQPYLPIDIEALEIYDRDGKLVDPHDYLPPESEDEEPAEEPTPATEKPAGQMTGVEARAARLKGVPINTQYENLSHKDKALLENWQRLAGVIKR